MNRIVHQFPVLLLAMSFALPVVFADTASAGKDAQNDAAQPIAKRLEVQLDPSAGSVEFQATGKPSAMHIIGKGPAPKGGFVLSGDHCTGAFVFDMTALKTGIEMRDHHMKEKYLEVEKYPTAELVLTSLKLPRNAPTDGSDAAFTGVPFEGPKLHGIEKTVAGTADLNVASSKATGTAKFGLKLSDYGIAVPSFAGITVAEDVAVAITGSGTVKK